MASGDKNFFGKQTGASKVKSEIVLNHFDSWSSIVIGQADRLGQSIAYMDLYCGPGIYEDGAKSTPLLVLEKAIAKAVAKPVFSERLVTIFNDKRGKSVETLEAEVQKLPDLKRLKHPPVILNEQISKETEEYASLDLPKRWKTGRTIFVNSMSDLFHAKVPLEFIRLVFSTMVETPQHTYQVLTKRPDRAEEFAKDLPWPNHVWLGTSVENADFAFRIDHLRRTPAAVKFLSLEPLLGPLEGLDLKGIDWAIAGGESGPGARPMEAEWVRSIRDQCVTAKVAFHFKQWGGVNKKRTGRVLDGQTWDQLPKRHQVEKHLGFAD